jgi:hypothetical protein
MLPMGRALRLRLTLTLDAPPFGLRRASLQPEPQRGRVSFIQDNAENGKGQNKTTARKEKVKSVT